MLFLLIPVKDYLARLAEPRSLVDIALVFLLVYGVLKLLRGTRSGGHGRGTGRVRFSLLARR